MLNVTVFYANDWIQHFISLNILEWGITAFIVVGDGGGKEM